MSAIENKTKKPLSVPLPGGKTLHLGPGKTAQIPAKAASSARIQALVDAGEIEIVDTGPSRGGNSGGGKGANAPSQGHSSGGAIRRSGDR